MQGRKKCSEKDINGNCPHHNIHCGFPKCEIQEGVSYQLGEKVLTDYYRNELFTVVGIRETELELEGDWSGGTNNVMQKSWYPCRKIWKIAED